jgi:hypothetical protein
MPRIVPESPLDLVNSTSGLILEGSDNPYESDFWFKLVTEKVKQEVWFEAWKKLLEFWFFQLLADIIGTTGTILVGGLLALLLASLFPGIKCMAEAITSKIDRFVASHEVAKCPPGGDIPQPSDQSEPWEEHAKRAEKARVKRSKKQTIPAAISTMGSIAIGGIWAVLFFHVVESYIFEGIRDIITIESIISISLGLALRPLMTNIIDGLLLVSTGKLHKGDHLFISGGSRYAGKVVSFDLAGALLEMEDVQGFSSAVIFGLAARSEMGKNEQKFCLSEEAQTTACTLASPFFVGKIPYSDVQNGMFYVIDEELMNEYIRDGVKARKAQRCNREPCARKEENKEAGKAGECGSSRAGDEAREHELVMAKQVISSHNSSPIVNLSR